MRVAIIGASNNTAKYGNKAVRSYHRNGHTVLPVNPHESSIEGLPAYPDITSVPGEVDRLLLYVAPEIGVTLLEAIAAKGVGEVYVNPGADSPELFEKAERLGLRMVFACAIVDIGDSPSLL